MTDLLVGVSSVCTTPDRPVWLHGYATDARQRPFEGKLQDLHAKALALEDAEGFRLLLVTVDLCVLRKTEAEKLAQGLSQRTGLSAERIIVNLSHTHSGPMISSESPRRYPMPAEMRERIGAYAEQLLERTGEAAARALSDLRPARLAWGRGRVDFVRNRRRFDENGVYSGMGPNPCGFTDPRVSVLRVTAPDGALRALVSSLACHAVTLGPQNLKLSGDYPGFAQAIVEARRPGAQAMFVQGCGADANPEPRSTPDQVDWVRRHGEELACESLRIAGDDPAPVRGPLRGARTWVDLPLRRPSRKQLEKDAAGPAYAAHNARRLLEMVERGETPPATHRAPISVWRFGEDLTLVGLPGETVSGYIPLIEEAIGPERLWIAGYCNEVFGYLPTRRIIQEGGYEDRGLVDEVGLFAPEAEDVVVDAVRRLVQQVSA